LIKRTPVHTDAYGFIVFCRCTNHKGKFLIAFCAFADIARVDAVFRQGLAALGKFSQ
jgi:hypothetical protein